MKKYYIIHNIELDRYEPLAITENFGEVEKLFESYKKHGYDKFLEVTEEKYNMVCVGK